MTTIKDSIEEPIEDEMRFGSLLQELLNAPATSMSAEEGFTLVDAVLSRLIECVNGKHYRVAPTNPEVQAGETNTDPKNKVTLGTVESRRTRRRGSLVQGPGPEQGAVILFLTKVREMVGGIGKEYLANGGPLTHRTEFLREMDKEASTLQDVALETQETSQKPINRLTDLEHRDRLLRRSLKQWQLTQPSSETTGRESNTWHGLTLQQLAKARSKAREKSNESWGKLLRGTRCFDGKKNKRK